MSIDIAYFPGCSLHSTASDFAKSIEAIMPALGINLKEIEDWNCCGASSAHKLDEFAAKALPARTIAIAANMKLDKILAPCAACYSGLLHAHHAVTHDPKLKKQIEETIGLTYPSKMQIMSLPEFLLSVAGEKIKSSVKRKLDVNVACYYGCLLTRPRELITYDDSECPQSMERLCQMMGINTVEWWAKTECCGAGFSLMDTDVVYKLTGDILGSARLEKAQVIITSCPLCHSNLDMRQAKIISKSKEEEIPVLYLSELVGYMIGLDPKDLGLSQHFATKKLKQIFI